MKLTLKKAIETLPEHLKPTVSRATLLRIIKMSSKDWSRTSCAGKSWIKIDPTELLRIMKILNESGSNYRSVNHETI